MRILERRRTVDDCEWRHIVIARQREVNRLDERPVGGGADGEARDEFRESAHRPLRRRLVHRPRDGAPDVAPERGGQYQIVIARRVDGGGVAAENVSQEKSAQ